MLSLAIEVLRRILVEGATLPDSGVSCRKLWLALLGVADRPVEHFSQSASLPAIELPGLGTNTSISIPGAVRARDEFALVDDCALDAADDADRKECLREDVPCTLSLSSESMVLEATDDSHSERGPRALTLLRLTPLTTEEPHSDEGLRARALWPTLLATEDPHSDERSSHWRSLMP